MACVWGKDFPSLTLPMSEAKGILKGPSRNPSTTCTRSKGSGGPDTVFVLPIAQRTTIELEVVSGIDTVVAIRSACDDPLTELACNDTPGTGTGGNVPGTGGSSGGPDRPPGVVIPPFFDGGAPPEPPSGDGRDGFVRATLHPGTYYVVVDEAEPFGVGGAFTLRVRSSAPVAHSVCAAARMLTDGTSLATEELDVASEKPPACTGVEPRPALFYSARIPSGQRLTVRAQPTGGDRTWIPVVQLSSGCGNGRCLGRDRPTQSGDRALRYVNNSATAEDVIVSVSPSTAVSAGTYRLDVSLGDVVQNGTCAAARPLTDGLILRNQDLSEGQISQNSGCKPLGGNSLFYSARLLPQQRLVVTAIARDRSTGGAIFLVLHGGCNQMDCRSAAPERLEYFNGTESSQTVVVEVASLGGFASQVFELTASMPLPPGGIVVRPTAGLTTTEAGGAATFEILLVAPPMSPVAIPIESGAPTEGSVSPASVTFTADDWDKPQKVTVTGVDDKARDGNQRYTVRVLPSMSADSRYLNVDADDVTVQNLDDEASFTFVGGVPLVTSESATDITFTAVLNKKPSADVRLPLSSSDPGEGTVKPAMLTFTPQNWNVPQFVTVTGVDDQEADGAQKYSVVTGVVVSADTEYSGLDPEDLEALNADNEFVTIPSQQVSGGLTCFNGEGRHIATDGTGSIYVTLNCLQRGGAADAGAAVAPDAGRLLFQQGPQTRDAGVGEDPVTAVDAGIAGGRGGSTGSGGNGSGGSSGGAAPVPPGIPVPPPPVVNPMSPAVFLVTSMDGGRSFTQPARIGVSEAQEVHVVGGGPGLLYVLASTSRGIVFVRSDDAGRSWSRPLVLATQIGGALRLAAAGTRVLITGVSSIGGAILWRSEDGGRTFQTSELEGLSFVFELAVDATGTAWLYTQNGGPLLWKSTDGGATFPTQTPLPSSAFFDTIAFGSKAMFATGKEAQLAVLSLDDPGKPRFVSGLSEQPLFPRRLIVHPDDGVTVLDSSFMGLQARRLTAGATSLGPARFLGGADGLPSGVALSDRAIAFVMQQGGQVAVSVQVWD